MPVGHRESRTRPLYLPKRTIASRGRDSKRQNEEKDQKRENRRRNTLDVRREREKTSDMRNGPCHGTSYLLSIVSCTYQIIALHPIMDISIQ